MGVLRQQRQAPHSNPIRHSLTRMFASGQNAGKGMYIGDDSTPPKHHPHHSHSRALGTTAGLASADSATANSRSVKDEGVSRSRPWRGGGSDPNTNDYKFLNYDTNGGDGKEISGAGTGGQSTDYVLGQYSHKGSLVNPSSSSSSLNPYQDTPSGASPYMESPVSPFSQPGHAPSRQNMTSFNSALSHGGHNPSPSSSSLSSSNLDFLNLGVDHASTVNPLQGHHHAQPLDSFSPTMEVPWNFTDDLCFNSSTGSYFNCWSYFDPNDNETMSRDTSQDVDYKYWTILLIIFPLFTVFGNVLVVLSVVKEKSLKTVTNYFICSLAVADIMVAVVVMPFAVYMEVMSNHWTFSAPLCDAWVASDVLACTASILNLTAISVDRFIAVTQPIKYAKHKNSKRVLIMLAITWVISVAIAAPIALGVNYSEDRDVGDCRFFNSDFIIYSSMGSFYIPSIIMIFLYWKIYRVIRLRALKAKKAKQMRNVDKRALQAVIENPAAAAPPAVADTGGVYGASEATVTTGLAKMDNGRVTTYNTTTSSKATTSRLFPGQRADDDSVTNVNSNSDDNSNDDDDDETPSGSGSANNNTTANDQKSAGGGKGMMHDNSRLVRNAEVAELITNPVAEELERREVEEQQAMLQFGKNGGCSTAAEGGGSGSASTSGGVGQTCANEAETPFTSLVCKGDSDNADPAQEGLTPPKKGSNSKRGHKKGVTKFNFHMRTSRKRKEKSSSKREKKATKTLAIVLGVFLVCWVPFFTINIISAICIRYDLDDFPACNMNPIFFSLFVWLGYINSFLNPVIYTIFNPEFRKAFKKLLTEPCR